MIVLLAYIVLIFSFITSFLFLFIVKPSLNTSFIVWQRQDAKINLQKKASESEITFIIQTNLGFIRSDFDNRLILTILRHLQSAKLKFTLF